MAHLDLDDLGAELDRRLAATDAALVAHHTGVARRSRQPVHTVYVPADRYDVKLVASWGDQALAMLGAHAGSPVALADATGLTHERAEDIRPQVRRKLAQEPIEDLRIDFEDGYGVRPDDREDADARKTAAALAEGQVADRAARYHGIRVKSLEADTRRRCLRTLDLVLGELVSAGGLTDSFVVTLPKVTSVDQVEAMAMMCTALERAHGLPQGRLAFEIQVETPQAILGSDGASPLPRMLQAADGRCAGLHFGTYDYSAGLGIAAGYQSLEHPAADHAKSVMQVAAAGPGVPVSDGSSNLLPVAGARGVRAVWRLHARLVRRSLERGFYQGWDLHPAQLVSRYAATFAFYREGFPTAAARLQTYLGTVEGVDAGSAAGYLDEPATAAALADFVLRGLDCGAVDESELASARLGVSRLRGLLRRPPGQCSG